MSIERRFALIGHSHGASGVSDHGALTGLADNDHPQYLLVADYDLTGYALLAGGGGQTFTGWHIFSGGCSLGVYSELTGSGVTPLAIAFYNNSWAANQRYWDFTTASDGSTMGFSAWSDTVVEHKAITATRSGATVTGVQFGNSADATSATHTFYGEITQPTTSGVENSFLWSAFPEGLKPSYIEMTDVQPEIWYYETDAASNEKWYAIGSSGGTFKLKMVNDAFGAESVALAVDRAGAVLDTMTYGNAADLPVHTFWGNVNFESSVDVASGLTVGGVGVSLDGHTHTLDQPAQVHDGAYVYRAASAQSISNATDTALTFDTEVRDDSGYADLGTNNDRLTIPVSGWYVVAGGVQYAYNSTGNRQLSIRVNGGTDRHGYVAVSAAASGSTPTRLSSSAIIYLTAGDYVQLYAYQDSGGALSASLSFGLPRLTIHRLGLATNPVAVNDGCEVTRTTDLAVSATTSTTVAFDTEGRDDNGYWAVGNPERFTIPASGWYVISFQTFWNSSNYRRGAFIRKNGTTTVGSTYIAAGVSPQVSATTVIYLTAGEYVDFAVYTDSASTLDSGTSSRRSRAAIHRLGTTSHNTPIIRETNIASSSAGSYVVSFGAAEEGDLFIMCFGGAFRPTAPTGWTVLDHPAAGSNYNGGTFCKKLTSTDISTGSVTVTMAGTYWTTYATICIEGAPGITGVTGVRSGSGASTSSLAAPYTTGDYDLVISFGSNRSTGSNTVNLGTQLEQSTSTDCATVLAAGATGMLTYTVSYPTAGSGYYQSLVVVRGG